MTEAPLPQSHRTLLADFARALDRQPAIVTVVNSSVVTGERCYEVKG